MSAGVEAWIGCIKWDEVKDMTSCELTAAITALANSIAAGRTTDELNILGVILTQLGDTILTIAAHRDICPGEGKSGRD